MSEPPWRRATIRAHYCSSFWAETFPTAGQAPELRSYPTVLLWNAVSGLRVTFVVHLVGHGTMVALPNLVNKVSFWARYAINCIELYLSFQL